MLVSSISSASSSRSLQTRLQLLEGLAQAMQLIHEMENDVDAFVIDTEIAFQIADEVRPGHVPVGEAHFRGGFVWNNPPLLQPELQHLHLKAGTRQELLLVHDHDVLSSRGLNALPLSQVETNASSSESGNLGNTTFSLTN